MTTVKVLIPIILLMVSITCMFLSLLFNYMIVYGHTPRDLLASTIISIPNDMRASLCNSDNYRGISLFNAI